MIIAIDLTSLYGRKRTGVEMYAIDLYRALLTTEHRIIPIFHVKNELDDNPNAFVISKCNRLLLENIVLKRAVRKIKPDIAFFPVFPPPIGVYNKQCKIFPTIHDTAFIRYKDTLNFAARFYNTPKFFRSMKKSDGIITISETVRSQLCQYTSIPVYNLGENIASEYKDAIAKSNKSLIEKWNLHEDDYYVSVSTIEPRKNLKYLLKVIAPILISQNRKLVLVGRRGWGKDNDLQALVEKIGDRLIFTDYVSMDELFSLYHFAYAFVLLSKDEGFGRTPFEAVACGCKRVVLSDIPIFHETFNENALFLPLDNVAMAREKMEYNEVLVNDLIVPFDILEKNVVSFL